MASKTKPKLKPRLAIGQPFVPAPPTQARAPVNVMSQGPATVVDDRTGKALLKVGDSPNGPEQLTVTPPEGMHVPSGAGGAKLTSGVPRMPGDDLIQPDQLEEAVQRHIRLWKAHGQGIDIMAYNSPYQTQYRYAHGINDGWKPGLPIAVIEGYKVPSAAGGGILTTGPQQSLVGGYADPTDRDLKRRQALMNASLNTRDQAAVALENTLDQTMNYKYGATGVAAPERRRQKLGQATSMSPFLQDAPSSQEDLLNDQYANEDLAQAQQDYANSKMPRASLATGGGGGGGASGTPTTSGGGGSQKLKAGPAGGGNKIQVTDPYTNETKYVDNQRDADKANAEFAGLVEYEDPYNPTGRPEYVTPAEAKIRKARDDRRMDEDLERRYPQAKRQLEELPVGDLIDALAHPETYADVFGKDVELAQQAIYREFAKRGFSQRAIDIMIARAKAKEDDSEDPNQYRKPKVDKITPTTPSNRDVGNPPVMGPPNPNRR